MPPKKLDWITECHDCSTTSILHEENIGLKPHKANYCPIDGEECGWGEWEHA